MHYSPCRTGPGREGSVKLRWLEQMRRRGDVNLSGQGSNGRLASSRSAEMVCPTWWPCFLITDADPHREDRRRRNGSGRLTSLRQLESDFLSKALWPGLTTHRGPKRAQAVASSCVQSPAMVISEGGGGGRGK
ncbi:uncharacterized protein A4U43_C08F30080 [Asparagus officinalis]|nr:uncharacterized protein A4U43_C08F30080 [Asparagus officinalis]